jgi:DNA polymerase I
VMWSVLPRLGVSVACAPGFEADDVMGTIARSAAARSRTSRIVSTDRDLTQLVDAWTSVVVPGKVPREVNTVQHVTEIMGVPPDGVTTVKALAGDASDNIPGLPGIGPKTAAALYTSYGSLEHIFDVLDSLPARIARILAAGREDAFLFRRLVTVVTDVPIDLDIDTLPTPAVPPRAREALEQTHYGNG